MAFRRIGKFMPTASEPEIGAVRRFIEPISSTPIRFRTELKEARFMIATRLLDISMPLTPPNDDSDETG